MIKLTFNTSELYFLSFMIILNICISVIYYIIFQYNLILLQISYIFIYYYFISIVNHLI